MGPAALARLGDAAFLAGVEARLEHEDSLLLPPSRMRVRFVHVSDTHSCHWKVRIPEGDVLVHTGDLLANYGRSDNLEKQLDDAFLWLAHLSKRFDRVLVIGGNHDTPLDIPQAKAKLHLPPNVVYIEGDKQRVDYRGLRIWMSPVTPSREETEGLRYVSNAFERTYKERISLWSDMPPDLDLLVTHSPPDAILAQPGVGDTVLRRRLDALGLRAPRVHCFGHDHVCIGMHRPSYQGATVYLNGAQAHILKCQRRAMASAIEENERGRALVFDLEARDQ